MSNQKQPDPIAEAQKKVDKQIADKAVADKAAADKAAADKAVADKAVADKAVADKAVADKAAADKAVGGFLNPFDKGVSYPDFLSSIPKGKTVKNHCKGKLSDSQIEWLEGDLKHFSKTKK